MHSLHNKTLTVGPPDKHVMNKTLNSERERVTENGLLSVYEWQWSGFIGGSCSLSIMEDQSPSDKHLKITGLLWDLKVKYSKSYSCCSFKPRPENQIRLYITTTTK